MDSACSHPPDACSLCAHTDHSVTGQPCVCKHQVRRLHICLPCSLPLHNTAIRKPSKEVLLIQGVLTWKGKPRQRTKHLLRQSKMRGSECKRLRWLWTTGDCTQDTKSCPYLPTPACDAAGPSHLQVGFPIPPSGLALGLVSTTQWGRSEAPEVVQLLPSLFYCCEECGSRHRVQNSGPTADDCRHAAPSPTNHPAAKTAKWVLTLEYKTGLIFEKQSMLLTVFTNQKSKTIQSTQ